MSKLATFSPVTITGPKEIVAILAHAIYNERQGANDPAKIAAMRSGMLAALSLCTVTVHNDSNPGDRWA